MTTPTDDLLGRARAGDRAALDALLEPHREQVRRLAAVLGSDDASADDVVQETLRLACADLARFDGRARLSTWLCGIALNLVRRARRDRDRHAVPSDPATFDARATRRGVLTSVIRRELAERLDDAVARLPNTLREAFVLHHVAGLDYDEVGRLLEVAPGTASVRAHRARGLLRSALGPSLGPEWLST